MKNPPHPGKVVLHDCIEPLGLTITDAAVALKITRNSLEHFIARRPQPAPAAKALHVTTK